MCGCVGLCMSVVFVVCELVWVWVCGFVWVSVLVWVCVVATSTNNSDRYRFSYVCMVATSTNNSDRYIASAIWSWEPCFDTCIDETPHHRNPSNCTEPGSLLTSPSCTAPWPPPATGSRWCRGTWHRRCSSRSRPSTTPTVYQTSNSIWRLCRCSQPFPWRT